MIRILNKSFNQQQLVNYLIKRKFLTAEFPELSSFPASVNSYEKLHKFSIENRDQFWGTLAKSRLQWNKEFKQVTTGKFTDKDVNLKWFIDGKLNASGIELIH